MYEKILDAKRLGLLRDLTSQDVERNMSAYSLPPKSIPGRSGPGMLFWGSCYIRISIHTSSYR